MLPVKKLDTERDDTNPPVALGFGKVLSSIQGLQQRLGDFSYGEVSIAEAKVKILVKQLSLLRDSLSRLIRLKHTVSDINRRQSEIPTLNLDRVDMNDLEKYPQLHAILQASKLVCGQRLMKGDFAGSHVVSLDAGITDSPDRALAAKETGAEPATERTGHIDKTEFTDARESARGPAEDSRVNNPSSIAGHRMTPKANKTPLASEELPSFTIPNETIAAFQDGQVDGQAKDWSFDGHESALTSSENFTAPIDFEFPDETVDDLEHASEKVAKTKLPRSGTAPTATIRQTLPNIPNAMETKAGGTAQAIPAKPAPEKSPARLAESKSLVPANQGIDHRLLEDVIRNYGDFAGSPNLPATLDTNTNIVPVTDTPTKTQAAELAQATAAERKILNVQKSGDLDRQLKKIIKDYGENDIYQQKSGISFKTGGIIAFAVLGLVLAVLYLYKAPGVVSIPQTGSVKQSLLPEPRNSPETASSPAAEPRHMGPDAANASSGPLKDDKQ